MASTKLQIPTINFCILDLKPNTPQWESTKKQVFEALKEYGCFEAIYDKVPNEIREAMFDTSKEIFEFPLSKLEEYRNKPYHIYDGKIANVPIYDCVKSADLLLPNSVETLANTFWPNGKPDYWNVAKSYYKPLMELDEMVKRMVLESLGLQNYLHKFLDSNYYLLRFTNYKPIKGGDGHEPGLGAHTDGGLSSMLHQIPMLFYQQKSSRHGQIVDCHLLIIGSIWKETMIDSSVQLFSSPNPYDKELVDEDYPVLFKPFKMVEYFEYI